MTTKTPLNPIVVKFNPLTVNWVQIMPNQYYWYSVIIYYANNYYRVYRGKAWSHPYNGDVNVGEVEVEISNILKPYMYESEYSIKPEFDVNTGDFHPNWNFNGEEVSTIDGNDPRTYGFGVMTYDVYLFNSSSAMALNNAVCAIGGEVTSSWDINSPAFYHTDDFLMQNLLELEFPKGFISHYPKISTTNFGVFGMVNVSDAYYQEYQEDRQGVSTMPIYIGNQVFHMEEQEHEQGQEPVYEKVYDAVELKIVYGNGYYYSGYLPFNLTLHDVMNTLRDVREAPVIFEEIIGADSTHTSLPNPNPLYEGETNFTGRGVESNVVLPGDSTHPTSNPTDTWIGGNAQPHSPARAGYDYSNILCIMTPDFTWGEGPSLEHPQGVPSTGYCIPFATFDECYSHYYLVWMTRSCTPVCYGFDGNTVFSQDFENTYMTSKYGNDILKIQTVSNKWELKSGVIDKNTYAVMEDIYTSPFLLLYDTHTDKYTYVKCEDNKFTRKNSVKEDQRPFTFTVNLTEVHKKELLH